MREPVHEIRRQHHVENTQPLPQRVRIAGFKTHPLRHDALGHARNQRRRQCALFHPQIGKRTTLSERPRGLDETLRVIHPDHLTAMPRQLKRRAPHRTSHIQRA